MLTEIETFWERKSSVRFSIFCFLLFALSLVNPSVSVAQPDGAALFDDLCADCHSIGDGVYRGPDLLGVEKRYSHDWLLKFIPSSKTMIEAGDAKAVAIFEKFKKKKMPDTHASVDEINAILKYIASFSKSEQPAETTKVEESKEENKDGDEKTEEEAIVDDSQTPSVSSTGGNDKIAELEEKINLLLKYHRRTASNEVSAEDIKKGMYLFSGRIPFKNGAPACVSCHNTKVIDDWNWNPSALDIAKRYSEKNNEDIEKVLAAPASRKMKEILEDHTLTEREIYTIKCYLQTIEETGLKPPKKKHMHLYLFIFFALLILIALIDLTVTKLIKLKIIPVMMILIGGVMVTKTLATETQKLGLSQNYEPDQPIKFSHKIHAGENHIACLYCHITAEYSKISGIPYDDICINCHNKIKSGTHSGTFEINKIYASIKNNKPIQWVKIHNLPDHVFYSHAQHVGAGKLECKTCHGEVEKMNRVRQVSPLSMQWCIDCHRKQEVQFMDNDYYKHYVQLHEDIKSGKIKAVTVDDIGGNDCQKCHY